MGHISFKLYFKILDVLTQNCFESYTLDELTLIVCSYYSCSDFSRNTISNQRSGESKVLDALLWLEGEGLVVLNPETDQCALHFKLLKKIKNKGFEC